LFGRQSPALTDWRRPADHDCMAIPPLITSRQNERVKDAVRLRTGRERGQQKQFIIDGSREISRALTAGIRCLVAFVCEPLCESTAGQSILTKLRATAVELLPVTPEVYAKLCFGDREEDGIVVVAETPVRRLEDLQLPTEPLVAVVEGIEKPGNLGAILRTADAAGLDAVIVADGGTDLFNPNVIRASLGTVFRNGVAEASTAEAIAWLRSRQLKIFAARPDASLTYTAADFRGGAALVLGSEATGLSPTWNQSDVAPVQLPMHGLADSLNVSTTAAVLFYEALRQRGSRPSDSTQT
jgi:RNA methyltransferase, TrmH family